jgi:BrxA
MSFSTGGLFINETVELARFHRCGETWKETVTRALEEGIAALPKSASRRRTLREVANRVSTLNSEERAFLIESADRQERQSLLWLATCRAYRFVREFCIEVLRERYLSYQLNLPLESFDVFFDAKAEWDEGLARISHSTKLKLRQVLFRIMREAGILSENNQILTAYLSQPLTEMINEGNPNEFLFFPGVSLDGAGI